MDDTDDGAPEIPFPEMPREYELRRSVPDHELLLVFRDDDHAQLFADWLQGDGWAAFGSWRGPSVTATPPEAAAAAVQAKRALEFRYRSMPWQDGKMPAPSEAETTTAMLEAAAPHITAELRTRLQAREDELSMQGRMITAARAEATAAERERCQDAIYRQAAAAVYAERERIRQLAGTMPAAELRDHLLGDTP